MRLPVAVLLVIVCIYSGCKTKADISNGGQQKSFSGASMEVSCKAGVPEELNVSIISGDHKEDFGAIGAPAERDSGKTLGFSPMRLDEKVEVRWGIEGEDYLEQTHSKIFDLSKYIPYGEQIDWVKFTYYGDGVWKFSAYDENKKEIIPEKHDSTGKKKPESSNDEK